MLIGHGINSRGCLQPEEGLRPASPGTDCHHATGKLCCTRVFGPKFQDSIGSLVYSKLEREKVGIGPR